MTSVLTLTLTLPMVLISNLKLNPHFKAKVSHEHNPGMEGLLLELGLKGVISSSDLLSGLHLGSMVTLWV